jgi:hypothetical protein
MKKSYVFLSVLVFVGSVTIMAKEKKARGKVVFPEAVQAAFKTTYPKAFIIGMSKETEKGVTYYEIESVDGKQKRDLLFTADGKVAEIEEAIDPAALPEAVTRILSKNFPDAKLLNAEALTKDGQKSFEVQMQLKGKKKEVAFDVFGKIIEKPASVEKNND